MSERAMEAAVELLPCPFCGGTNLRVQTAHDHIPPGAMGIGSSGGTVSREVIWCHACGTFPHGREWWNARAALAAAQRVDAPDTSYAEVSTEQIRLMNEHAAAQRVAGEATSDFRALVENKLKQAEGGDPSNAPFGLDDNECHLWLKAQSSVLQWVLEMFPAPPALALSPGKVEGWREIESAPTDGTPILLWRPYHSVTQAHAYPECWKDFPSTNPKWFWQLNRSTNSDRAHSEVPFEPTRWMPIPSPPIRSSRAEDLDNPQGKAPDTHSTPDE